MGLVSRDRFLRRSGLAATLLSGATLFGMGVTGVAGVDANLENAAQPAKPQPTSVIQRDCPEKKHGAWRDS